MFSCSPVWPPSPIVMVMAFLVGSIAAFDGPARQAFVSEMVDVEDLPNAVALNTASFNLGRVFGPAVAGLLIAAVGSGWVFIVNTVGYVAVLVALSRIRQADLATPVRPGCRCRWPARRHPLRAVASRPGAGAVDRVLRRNVRSQLPAHDRRHGHRGVRASARPRSVWRPRFWRSARWPVHWRLPDAAPPESASSSSLRSSSELRP